MAHPGLALLLAGKLGKPEPDEEGGQDDKEDAKVDAARHLIAAVRGVKPDDVHDRDASDVLECFQNLNELCREEEPEEDEEDDKSRDLNEDSSY